MCHLCLVSESSFLRNLRAFLQKEFLKKVAKLQSGIFGLFELQWLPGFQTLIVAIFQGIQDKKTKKIENRNPEGKSQLLI